MIHWTLDEKEADYILQCVQQRPFAEVHILVKKLVDQANPPRAPTPEELEKYRREMAPSNQVVIKNNEVLQGTYQPSPEWGVPPPKAVADLTMDEKFTLVAHRMGLLPPSLSPHEGVMPDTDRC